VLILGISISPVKNLGQIFSPRVAQIFIQNNRHQWQNATFIGNNLGSKALKILLKFVMIECYPG
jgi:hypothetical protein